MVNTLLTAEPTRIISLWLEIRPVGPVTNKWYILTSFCQSLPVSENKKRAFCMKEEGGKKKIIYS